MENVLFMNIQSNPKRRRRGMKPLAHYLELAKLFAMLAVGYIAFCYLLATGKDLGDDLD